MGVTAFITALVIGLIAGWLVRHYFKTPGFKSDTTQFFRQSGTTLKFYTMPTLIGTLLVSLSVLGVARSKLSEWDAIEEKGGAIRERQYQLFRVDVMIAALTTWYAFINPAWQRARQKHESEHTKPPLG